MIDDAQPKSTAVSLVFQGAGRLRLWKKASRAPEPHHSGLSRLGLLNLALRQEWASSLYRTRATQHDVSSAPVVIFYIYHSSTMTSVLIAVFKRQSQN